MNKLTVNLSLDKLYFGFRQLKNRCVLKYGKIVFPLSL